MPTKVEVETNTEVLIDIWNQIIGPKRVNIEVQHAEEALLTLAKEKCESVLHLLLKLSHTDVLKQLAYIHAELLEGMARTRLRIYRESWRKQGHVETSESLDATWEYGLVPVFDWCRENIERLLNKQMMWDKIPMTNLVRTGMGFFDEKANEFKKRLQEEVEIAKPFQVQAADIEKVQEGAPAQATITGTSPKLRDELVAIKIRKNPNTSYAKLCEIFDCVPIPTLKGWEPLWSETLRKDITHGRTRVKKHIGMIRKSLGLTNKKRVKT